MNSRSASSDSNDRSRPAIVWFRDDLRVDDNPALNAAAQTGASVFPVYVYDTVSPDIRESGAAQKWMLHYALEELDASLKAIGLKLTILAGPAEDIICSLADHCGAQAVFWNRRYGAAEIEIDMAVKRRLGEAGLRVKSFQGNLLHEPTQLLTSKDDPYKVYSPFWRAFEKTGTPRQPRDSPSELVPFSTRLTSDLDRLELSDLKLLPHTPDWAGGLRKTWAHGEKGAQRVLKEFLRDGLKGYAGGRDMPADGHVSRLSPYLRHGMISPYRVWHAVGASNAPDRDKAKFLKELGWREFSYHLLYHFPQIGWRNFDERFDVFPWEHKQSRLEAWQRGKTGYPIVDAGMRELWETGYMHNRVRMVTASFLVKHLMIDWRDGETWFWDTLVDGDPANNPASWQWVAGCGADAAPYFRIFNPILQGRKFDANGAYVRRWVPEIADLPDKYLHAPWEADDETLAQAGISLGATYPKPMVDHSDARERALEAFDGIKKAA